MSYETVIDQVKSLPESSLEEVSRYIEFLLYQQEQMDMELMQSKLQEMLKLDTQQLTYIHQMKQKYL